MRVGFHISISGGFSKVVERATIRDCQTIQFFSRNPRGWHYEPFDEADLEAYHASLEGSGLFPVFLHLPYLPNIAFRASKFYKRSVTSIVTDLRRAQTLKAPYLVIHIGHRMESTEEDAIRAVCQGIDRALEEVDNEVMLLLENTAGQGTEIGSRFEQIRDILAGVANPKRLGVCLDTAHSFEAGYDLSTNEGLERTLEAFDRTIGLRRLHLLHLNDSKTPLGSRKDRHWHIGEGCIGLEGFRRIVNHPRLAHLPGIMETPRKDTVEDLKNMKVIRSLVERG